MTKPAVSVVMSVYNEDADYLKSAIESIVAQTLNSIEFLIVCDNPDYEHVRIIDEYARNHSCITIIRNAENMGLAASLNTAIMQSSGEYVARMDADDVSMPDRLARQYDYMERHPEIGMLGMQAVNVDEHGNEIRISRKPLSYGAIKEYAKYACPLIHPVWFVRKRVYVELGGYMNMSPAQDYHFIAKALRAGVIINNLAEVGLKYTVREKSVSRNSIYKTISITQIIRRSVLKGVSMDNVLLKYAGDAGRFYSPYLERVYDLRCQFISYHKHGKTRLTKFLSLVMIVVISSMHLMLLRDTIAVYKSTKIL